MAGAQMTHNNPYIADLSDAFRPTKISEEYTQLYDNQWTDAFEEMEKNGTAEQSIITTLLARLKECHEFCNTVSLKFTDQLETSSLVLPGSKSPAKSEHMSVVYKKLLQDMKKNFGVLLRDQIKELYWSENKKNETKRALAYIDACIDLCWLMAIQEPPVVIDDPAKKSSSFDSDMYRTYTTSGTKIDFVVWPPLRLHKGGPLLSKGVAQGSK